MTTTMMNLPLFLSNCCGDCPDRSKIPMLIYQNRHYDRWPDNKYQSQATSRSEVFYDCHSVKSRRDLTRRRSKSSSQIGLDDCRHYLTANASFMSIESQYSLKQASSELMLKQCKKLLDIYSINISNALADGTVLPIEDLELLRRIIRANERYHYLSSSKIQIIRTLVENAEKHNRLREESKEKMEANDCLDGAWGMIEEIFRKHSNTRQQSSKQILSIKEVSTEAPSEVSLHGRTREIDEYLMLSEDEHFAELSPEEMIDKISYDSLELHREDDYNLDYSMIFSILDSPHDDESSEQVESEARRNGSQLLSPSILELHRKIGFHKVEYEWYAFRQEVRRILRYIRKKSAMVGICVEFEIRCMTFEELQRTEKFYKLNSNSEGIELTPMNLEKIRRCPEDLFDILKPSDISYLHRKVMRDLEERFVGLHEKLQKIQMSKAPVTEPCEIFTKNKGKKKACKRKSIEKVKNLRCSKKHTTKKIADEFFEVKSSSSDQSVVSSYMTARDLVRPDDIRNDVTQSFFAKLFKG